MNQLKLLWSSLPHPVQALIIAFATAAGTTLLHALSEGNCFTAICLKHALASSLLAGVAAARAFYMVPNRQQPPDPTPPNVSRVL